MKPSFPSGKRKWLWVAVPAALLTLLGANAARAASPVPGARLVRGVNYSKQPANYLSSNLYTTLATERDTFNKFVAFDFQIPDGGGPLPHHHRNEWETFFVDEGSVTFTIGVDPNPPFGFITQEVPDGSLVFGPQCPVHGFQNTSGSFARIFSFALPGGLHNFFVTSGEPVKNYNAPIPPIGLPEILRTAFWAEQRGDALQFPGAPPPDCPSNTPEHKIVSIFDPNNPTFTGPFGETRHSLLTPEEVGSITGATAFCGPGLPGRSGGTVAYTYVSLPPGTPFAAPFTSDNEYEVLFVLGGKLSVRMTDVQSNKTADVETGRLGFLQIQQGVPFTIGNRGKEPANALWVSVINACGA